MATYYVNAAGSSRDGTTMLKGDATFDDCMTGVNHTAVAAGDTILIAHDHTEDYGAATPKTWTLGANANNKVIIRSVDRNGTAGSEPYLAGAQIGNSTSNGSSSDITLSFSFDMAGVTVASGDALDIGQAQGSIKMYECILSTRRDAGSQVTFNGNPCDFEMTKIGYDPRNTQQKLNFTVSRGGSYLFRDWYMVNGCAAIASICNVGSFYTGPLLWQGFDLTNRASDAGRGNVSTTADFFSAPPDESDAFYWHLIGVDIPSGGDWNFADSGKSGRKQLVAVYTDPSNSDLEVMEVISGPGESITQESVVLNASAANGTQSLLKDGTTAFAHKIVTNANCSPSNPFIMPIGKFYAEAGDVLTLEMLHSTTTDLYAHEAYLVISGLDSDGVRTLWSTSPSDLISLTTAIRYSGGGSTPGSNTWDGGLSNQVYYAPQYDMSTDSLAGEVDVELYIAKASVTVYANGLIDVS